MKIATEDFAKLASAAANTARDKHPNPFGQMARIECVGGVMSIVATDFEYWLTMRAPCDGDLGAVLVSAAKLSDVAAKLKGDVVDVTVDADGLHIKAGKSKRKLATQPAASYPELPVLAGVDVAVDGARLKECIAYCLPYASTDIGRSYICGVHIEGSSVSATDGSTMAQIEYAPDAELPSVTLSAAFVKAIREAAPDDEITMIEGNRQVALRWADGSIQGPAVEGQFPDVARIVPRDHTTSVTIDASDAATAISGTKALSDGRGLVAMIVTADGVEMRAQSQAGEAIDAIDAKFDGEPMDVGFNSVYLDRVMRGFAKCAVRIDMTTPASPAKFSSADASDRIAVVMPMRI